MRNERNEKGVMARQFRIVETDPDCKVAVYEGSLRWDIFESREEAAVWIDHTLRLHEVDNRFKVGHLQRTHW